MPSLEENRQWDWYDWPQDGDEWSDQAAFCGVPYPTWKADVVDAFILPHVAPAGTVLEMAVGHGRWTPFLAQRARHYIGVDLGPLSVQFCRQRFAGLPNVEFHANDGRAIPMVATGSIQFVWCFDSFVHMEPDITEAYLAEFARVLQPGGRGVIHHPGTPDPTQRTNGGRSQTTSALFARLAGAHGLKVLSQVDSWGPGGRSNTKLFADSISTLEKPASQAG